MAAVLRFAENVRHRLGVDRAIAYSFAAKLCMIIGSMGTVLLIVHFLSTIQQGYYYTLLSLISLQVVFELGFSFVILQLAAHEAIHLQFHHDGRVEGTPVALSRLSVIFRKTVRWYSLVSAIMLCAILATGILFFRHTAPNQGSVWLGPWIAAVVMTVILFVLNPFASFLEGCGQVRQVAGMRFFQAAACLVFAWSAMFLGKGLYSPAAVNAGQAIVVLWFLLSRRKLFRHLLRVRTSPGLLSWRDEVWSFQWKIAVTWLCSYFTVYILTPILFASRGPVEAGRLGMSISIATYNWQLVFTWMSTKAAPFGRFVAAKDYAGLDKIFFKTFYVSLVVAGIFAFTCLTGIVAVQSIFPNFATRMVSPWMFALLLLAAVGNLIVQSEAIYLRAHKEEPLLWQALAVAAMNTAGAYFAAAKWGLAGMCITYFICTGAIGTASATAIFRSKRRSRELQRSVSGTLSMETIS